MKKVGQFRKNKPVRPVDPFYHENVIDYATDMKVDPLTTKDQIAEEIQDLELKKQKREKEAAIAAEEKAKKEADLNDKPEEEKHSENDASES